MEQATDQVTIIEMKLASIQKVLAIHPIEGADRVETACVLGYQTVIRKGELKVGELGVWHEPDTVLPEKPQYEFLKPSYRLRTTRIRQTLSQGLMLPLSILPEGQWCIDDDVTDIIGIQKYEKPIPAQLAGTVKGNFPSWLRKTDEPNLQSFPSLLQEFQGKECVATVKIDGSSGTFYIKDNVFGVCSRNLDLKPDDNNTFWRVARAYNVEAALRTLPFNVAIQGEVYGEGIEKNKLNVKGQHLAVFNLYDIDRQEYIDYQAMVAFCIANTLPMASAVWRGKFEFTMEDALHLAASVEYGPGQIAEGIVIRPVSEMRSVRRDIGRLSAKIRNEVYMMKKGE